MPEKVLLGQQVVFESPFNSIRLKKNEDESIMMDWSYNAEKASVPQ